MKIQRRLITSEFCTSFPVPRYQLVIINANPKPYIPLETSYCHQAWQIALFDICSLLHLQCQSQNWKPCKAWAPRLFPSSKTLPSSHFSSLGLHPFISPQSDWTKKPYLNKCPFTRYCWWWLPCPITCERSRLLLFKQGSFNFEDAWDNVSKMLAFQELSGLLIVIRLSG